MQHPNHLFLLEDLIQLMHETVDILELAVNRSKSNICNFIQRLQSFHDKVTNMGSRNLTIQRVLDDLLNLVCNRFQISHRYRPLFTCTNHTIQDLIAVKRLAAIILLYHDHGKAFNCFIRGKTLLTGKTLSSATNGCAVIRMTGVNDLTLLITAIRTLHNPVPLFL